MGCGSLGAAVKYVRWDDTIGVSYPSSGSTVGAFFTDPSPYQALIDTWMTTEAALSLAQAQAIKSDLVAAIFNYKRTEPIAYNIAAGNFSWDCSDESLNAMTMAMVSAQNSGMVSATNSALSTIAGQINSAFSTGFTSVNNAIVALVNEINAAFSSVASATTTVINSVIGNINSALSTLTGDVNSEQSGFVSEINAMVGPNTGATIGTINYAIANPSAVNQISAPSSYSSPTVPTTTEGAAGISDESATAPAITGTSINGADALGNMQWTPIGRTNPVTLTGTEFAGLVASIVIRRASLITSKATMLASIAAASSVTNVAAFDATFVGAGGWPY